MKILVCCSAGMSTSILVKSMNKACEELNLKDYKIGACDAALVFKYVSQVDLILVAPQLVHELGRIEEQASVFNVQVILLDKELFGRMDGREIILTLPDLLKKNQEVDDMDKLSKIIEEKLMPIALKVGSNKVLTIIRNAMIATMALLIIGSIAILIPNLPIEAVTKFLEPYAPFFNSIYSVTTGAMGLFAAASTAYYASIEYETDTFTSVLTSVATFLLTQFNTDGTLNYDGLGSMGLVTAMVVGFATVKTMQFCKKRNIGIKMPEGVPTAVSESFSSLIPAVFVLGVFGILSIGFGFNINELLGIVLKPISSTLNTPFGYALYHMLCGLFFFCGINSAVVIGVFQAFLMQNGAVNEAAYVAGKQMIFPATVSTDTMIWAGGTGATIGLVLLLSFFAKSEYYRTIGKMSIAPGIFNINEPVIFGLPICFNPLFLIPFVLIPGILAFATYVLMSMGIVAMPSVAMVPWTIPPVLVGFMMTNGSISATVWGVIVVLISVVGYYPFFKIADNQEYKKELEESKKAEAMADNQGANA